MYTTPPPPKFLAEAHAMPKRRSSARYTTATSTPHKDDVHIQHIHQDEFRLGRYFIIKSFSEADITGIQRLGEGSKSLDPNKTGQYGVGFNCVYHLTDAPSFLTATENGGHSLCVFDPHGKYVPGATTEEPGRRWVQT